MKHSSSSTPPPAAKRISLAPPVEDADKAKNLLLLHTWDKLDVFNPPMMICGVLTAKGETTQGSTGPFRMSQFLDKNGVTYRVSAFGRQGVRNTNLDRASLGDVIHYVGFKKGKGSSRQIVVNDNAKNFLCEVYAGKQDDTNTNIEDLTSLKAGSSVNVVVRALRVYANGNALLVDTTGVVVAALLKGTVVQKLLQQVSKGLQAVDVEDSPLPLLKFRTMTLCNDAGTYLRCGEFSTLEFPDEEDDDDSEAWTALDLHHKYVSEKSGSVYIGNTTKPMDSYDVLTKPEGYTDLPTLFNDCPGRTRSVEDVNQIFASELPLVVVFRALLENATPNAQRGSVSLDFRDNSGAIYVSAWGDVASGLLGMASKDYQKIPDLILQSNFRDKMVDEIYFVRARMVEKGGKKYLNLLDACLSSAPASTASGF